MHENKVEFLHLEGTFMSGSPFGKKTPLKDHAMLAAIIEALKEHTDYLKVLGVY